MKDDWVYVQHILDAIAQIERYVKNLTYKKFMRARLVQDGVIRQITIIGEASRQTAPDFQSAHPEIPWADVIGMRNILVHDYLGVNLNDVWEVTQEDLPKLKKQLKQILRDAREKPG